MIAKLKAAMTAENRCCFTKLRIVTIDHSRIIMYESHKTSFLYGSETWVVSKALERKILAWETKFFAESRQRYDKPNLVSIVRDNQMQMGHVTRMWAMWLNGHPELDGNQKMANSPKKRKDNYKRDLGSWRTVAPKNK